MSTTEKTLSKRVVLKAVEYTESMSEETECFTASVYIDGKKVGSTSNRGQGGSNDYHPHTLEKQIQDVAKEEGLFHVLTENKPEDLCADSVCGYLLADHLTKKDLQKGLRTHLLYLRGNEVREIKYKHIGWKPQETLAQPKLLAKVKEYYKIDVFLNELPFEEALEKYKTAIGKGLEQLS